MHAFTPWRAWIGVCAAALISSGCGDSDDVAVYPVRGKVTFEGKPLPGGGTIAFVPLEDQAGKTAGGEITEDGTYELTTYGPGDGSMAGEFRVIITQVVEREPPPSEDGEPPPKPTAAVPLADRIPEIYSHYENSPLRATVEAKSLNEIDFPLQRQ
jgi:hypothetical protein